MKGNFQFFSIVLLLLLASLIVLTGCMYAIAADNGEMKSYDLNGQKQNSDRSVDNIVEENAPLAQTALQKNFSAYLHEDGNTVTIFSEEQYAELRAVRENGNRNPLTYEEILFLVNDSINLYFTYDEIRLTNSNRDCVAPLAYEQSSNACVIYPEYKDATAYETYSEAETAYYKMLADIYGIIFYRIYMHDAGFEAMFPHYLNDENLIFGRVPTECYQMLAIDNATFSGVENREKLVGEYKTLLKRKSIFESDTIIDYHYPYFNFAVLYTSILNTSSEPIEYRFYIAGPKDEPCQQIYPTAELYNLMPHQEFLYEAKVSNSTFQPIFSLDYGTGTFGMSADSRTSFAIVGKFSVNEGVLKIFPTNVGDEGVYSYILHWQDGTWVYSAENSKPIEVAGFDWADGIVFEKVYKSVSINPNIDPPVNNNNKNEVEMPYFKLYLAERMCSLMASDGYAVANGTYAMENGAHILRFDGDFQYTFYYNEGIGYEYAKDESNAIPGYEIEDGTTFSLIDGILTANDD